MNLVLKKVESKEDKELAKYIIENYHSYVPSYKSVGRRIDWLISVDSEAIGVIGIGSSTYPPSKDMLRYLDLTKDSYRKIFNTFGNNWRFCLKPHSIRNLGSQILKEFRKQARIEWKQKYGDELNFLITFVGGGNNGAVYKSDNWKLVGETAGLPKHKSSSMKWHSKEELSKKFVKPTGENKKLIFLYQY